jgi:hypothetical protein
VKQVPRQPHQGRSRYLALLVFGLAYAAAFAVVVVPDQVRNTMDGVLIWPLE